MMHLVGAQKQIMRNGVMHFFQKSCQFIKNIHKYFCCYNYRICKYDQSIVDQLTFGSRNIQWQLLSRCIFSFLKFNHRTDVEIKITPVYFQDFDCACFQRLRDCSFCIPC
ncbi:unnamed protein product [Coffea canephora]|uniref:Uncharacterized protein n=1 Tax=Coffea canephora TaxID=49390 RepID=A0A068UFF9_COFCA|nr:unnamed protein product [Coffea canephora]